MLSSRSFNFNPSVVMSDYLFEPRKKERGDVESLNGKKLFNKIDNLVFIFGHLLPEAYASTFNVCIS